MIRLGLLIGLLFAQQVNALTDIEIKKLDSLNLNTANIRVNQEGYGVDRVDKKAFVTAYGTYAPQKDDSFYIIDNEKKSVVYEGKLQDSDCDFQRGSLSIKAYFSSVTELYTMSKENGKEHIYIANFSDFATTGTYALVCDADTSHPFTISDKIYSDLYTSQLKYMAFQRCGEKTWAHDACHTHDGEDVGHDGAFTGGWHDMGDHVKLAITLGYRSYILALAATVDQLKKDEWNSAVSSNMGDGIPDMLYELYQVSNYIMNLYSASKDDGVLPDNMYHSVGNSDDHNWWGRPEWQDNMSADFGGRARPTTMSMPVDVAAKYGATLALFSKLWAPYDNQFADRCLSASIDLYNNYVLKNLDKTDGKDYDGIYQNNGRNEDEIAAHVIALLYVTKDEFYKKELLENEENGSSIGYSFNANLFKAGWLAHQGEVVFHPGGWPQDFENMYATVLFSFKTLLLINKEEAVTYGFSEEEYNEYSIRTAHVMLKNLEAGGLLKNRDDLSEGGSLIAAPYNLPNFNMAWGFNRYCSDMSIMGYLFNVAFGNEIFQVSDGLSNTTTYKGKPTANFSNGSWMTQQADSHLDYLLGRNPWDISFIAGLGVKELHHVHNRTANDEMISDVGLHYDYTVPTGGLYGGVSIFTKDKDMPLTLAVDGQNYLVTELEMGSHLLLYSVLKMNGSKVTTSIEDRKFEIVKNSSVHFSPNPVVDMIKVVSSYEFDVSADLEILSTAEEIVYSEKIGSLKMFSKIVDVTNLEKGTYYILLKSNGKILYKDIFYKK